MPISQEQSLALIKSLGDWDHYCRVMCAQWSVDVAAVQWGKGPLAYPCLVSSCRAAADKIVSCYVYLGDAQRLLQAVEPYTAAPAVELDSLKNDEQPPVELARTFAQVKAVLDRVSQLHESAKENRRYSAALDLTVVYFLVTTGICTMPAFEERFARFLAMVDQHGDDKGKEVAMTSKAVRDLVKKAEDV